MRILKRFIEKQTLKLKEVDMYDLESVTELLAAFKELTELSSTDKLSFLQQASCLADRCLQPGFNLEYYKWMLSYSWNLGVQAYQRDSDKESAKRFFQFSTQLLLQCQRVCADWPATDDVFQLKSYIDVVGAKMNEVHRKVLFDIY